MIAIPLKTTRLLQYSHWTVYGIKKFSLIKVKTLKMYKCGTNNSQHLFGKFQGNPFFISLCFHNQTINNQIKSVTCETRLVYYWPVTCDYYWQSIFQMVRQQNTENISSGKGAINYKKSERKISRFSFKKMNLLIELSIPYKAGGTKTQYVWGTIWYIRFFYKQRFFSTRPRCCLLFS